MTFSSRLRPFVKDLIPPVASRAINRWIRGSVTDPELTARQAFYGTLLPKGALCFDIGANVGNRVAAFRCLDMRVVALEPQPRCFARLKAAFGEDRHVTLVNKAVGSTHGKAAMMVSNIDVISTMSPEFVDATTKSKRFGTAVWDETIQIDVVTLDELIEAYGKPYFIKIDVEGYELEVVRGLSQPIALISLEWIPELTDVLLAAVAHLSELSSLEFNLSWMESMRLSRTKWMDGESLERILNEFREETYLFGDVYVRSRI